MMKRKQYSEEEKAALAAMSICGQLTQDGVDQHTKLLDFPPQPIQGIEPFIEEKHAPSILGLVAHPAFQHWMLLDALNIVVMVDLKWCDPLIEPRNKPKIEIDHLVEQAKVVYAHFSTPPPSPAKLRIAMVNRVYQLTPTKVSVAPYVRCNHTVSDIGSKAIDYTVSIK